MIARARAFTLLVVLSAVVAASCGGPSAGATTPTWEGTYDRLPRLRFNQLAMRLNQPLFWAGDANGNAMADPSEVRALRFYPTEGHWVETDAFTDDFARVYGEMVRADSAPAPTDPRRAAVIEELDSIAPTLIENDLRDMPESHREFARHMARVAELTDRLYGRQMGMEPLASRVAPDDAASQSLFRRNWGPRCRGATTESNPACSAIEGAPREPVDVYPAGLQTDDGFCQILEARPDAGDLMTPFSVVRETADGLVAMPYPVAYGDLMEPIAAELRLAARAMRDPDEQPLREYLLAAAEAFGTNHWEPADEAWAAMNVRNSHWYVRIAPDEVYWEPCSQKAGFHLTLALINRGSLEWQDRLTPIQQRMEQSLSDLTNDTYHARAVSFHLPDFIDIVLNAGDDRDSFGATIGQSLPNWGPVSDEGRGRTVAMTNLYTDPDSLARRREVASSLFSEATMGAYTTDATPGLLSTILHEATHNLGPASEHRVDGHSAAEVFGGGLASMLEELKAQSGALFYVQMLVDEGILTPEQQRQVYMDSMVWAMGHISRGMYTPDGQRKAYSQLAAVQVGFLMDRGVIRWDADAMAANGRDRGAFTIDFDAFPAAAAVLMAEVVRIKATGDRAGAEALATRFVDSEVIPQPVVVERHNRLPRTSFVYALEI